MNKKEIIIAVTITIIFALFVGYGIEVFNPSTKYDDFCPKDVYNIDNQEACLNAGGEWGIEGTMEYPRPVKLDQGEEIQPYCYAPQRCYDQFETATTKHNKIVFIVAVIIGILSIIAGIILKKDPVSTGILGGGVLTIIYGTIRYWQYANNILKFVLLGIVLAILIWIGYKKLGK